MTRKRRFGWFLSLAVLLISPLLVTGQQAELNQIGTSMANFLKIGVGARASAMGDAYVALADDISALYWNPGGISTLENNQMMFQAAEWLVDTRLTFFGFSYRLGLLGVFGVSVYSFSSGEMLETTIEYPDGRGRTFSASNLAAALTYSRQLTDRFFTGITLKYITEQLDRETAQTVAIDVGSVFVTNFLNDLRIGFSLSNLGGTMKLDGSGLNEQFLTDLGVMHYTRLTTEPWDIPLLFRFGVATDVIRNSSLRLTTSTEIMDSRDYYDRIGTGLELAIREVVFLRGGYKFRYDEVSSTLGAGLRFTTQSGMGLHIDYAYVDYGIFDITQKFSIIFMFK